MTELLDTGIITGRIEALTKLRSILVEEITYQEKGYSKLDRVKYKTQGIDVSRPLLPGLKEAVKQIEKLLKAYKNEEHRKNRKKG